MAHQLKLEPLFLPVEIGPVGLVRGTDQLARARPQQRAAVSDGVIPSLTRNDTKLERGALQVVDLLVDLIGIEPMTSSMP